MIHLPVFVVVVAVVDVFITAHELLKFKNVPINALKGKR